MIHRIIFIFGLWPLHMVAQLPTGFVDELISDQFEAAVGVEFVDSQLAYVWTQNGLISVLEHGQLVDTLLNIGTEVSGTGDHGMLGLALDPAFEENGYLYLSYVVDPHYLRFFNTPLYDPPEFDEWGATIGRVTRYQIDLISKRDVVAGSRHVLLGDSIHNGIPVLAPAHGVGGLDFGTDGTLLIGTGDGTTWVGNHSGGPDYKEFGFDSLGLVLGIIDTVQDVGSYRSQLLNSYSGKILRINPITGLGLPSNPYYDPQHPEDPRSKVWALGLRSPFRIRVRPGSGKPDPSLGQPGTIYIGDVGSNQFEELNIISEPGRNLGWPIFEGHQKNKGYTSQAVENKSLVNPAGKEDCATYLRFDDLLIAPNRHHLYHWPNPCIPEKSLEDSFNVFVHHPPTIAYGNTVNNPNQTFLPGYDSLGEATHLPLNDLSSPVMGEHFDGISSVAGDFYLGEVFPARYSNSYLHGDFSGWIKHLQFDVHDGIDEIHTIRDFAENTHSVVYVRYNRFDQAIYYVVLDYSDRPNLYQLRKISFTDNPKPVAVIQIDSTYGQSPLSVHLSATESYDPAHESLTFMWVIDGKDTFHFEDSTLQIIENDLPRNISIQLTVTDESGLSNTAEQFISINNSPPIAQITSISDGQTYRLDVREFDLVLEGTASDHEQLDEELQYRWEIKLKHNDHFHVEFVDTNKASGATLPALPSTALDKHAYLVGLTVTDDLGLEGYDEVLIEPLLSTGIGSYQPNHRFTLFPNPSSRDVTIGRRDRIPMTIPYWQLVDTQGKLIMDGGPIRLPHALPSQPLPHGTYFIKLFDPMHGVQLLKLIKASKE